MDWLLDLQASLREPVFAILRTWWPVIATVALLGLGWYAGALTRAREPGSDALLDEDGDSGSD